jgi:F0F1-type ATP synthase membrane subunit b/b'
MASTPEEPLVPPMAPEPQGPGFTEDTLTRTRSDGDPATDSQSTADTAKGEARRVQETATQQAGQVTDTAKEQAGQVATDVKAQAQQLADKTKNQLSDQAGGQLERAAEALRSLGSELAEMAERSESSGVATQLARQGADLSRQAADFISSRDPGQLLDEVRSFAARRPAGFLLGAAVAGALVGRLTRGVVSSRSSEDSAGQSLTEAPYGLPRQGIGAGSVYDTAAAPEPAPAMAQPTGWPSEQRGAAPTTEAPPIVTEPYGEEPPPGYVGSSTGGPG